MQCARVLLSLNSNFSRHSNCTRFAQTVSSYLHMAHNKCSETITKTVIQKRLSEDQIVILLVHFGFTSSKFLFRSCFKDLIHVTVNVAFYVFTVIDGKAACKRTQHCWPTTPNIVECYMLRPLAHPVACCCVLLRKVWNRSNFSANNS